MGVTMRLEGFAELDAELAALSKSMGKAVLRRALREAAEPMAQIAAGLAPEDDGTLKASIAVSTKLSKRQAKMHRRMFRNDRASVEMFVGAGPLSSAHNQEFGNENHNPQPFMRPAWDRDRVPLVNRLKDHIRAQIDKATERARRRAAKRARG